MTERAEPRNQKPQKPAPKPGPEMTERDLDKVSGGLNKTPTPSGPIPIPYPNQG